LETQRAGVFLAGAGIGPKDIPEAVWQGSGAAGKVLSLLSRWTKEAEATAEDTAPAQDND
jgi:heterodisulfide reductase subunit A